MYNCIWYITMRITKWIISQLHKTTRTNKSGKYPSAMRAKKYTNETRLTMIVHILFRFTMQHYTTLAKSQISAYNFTQTYKIATILNPICSWHTTLFLMPKTYMSSDLFDIIVFRSLNSFYFFAVDISITYNLKFLDRFLAQIYLQMSASFYTGGVFA